MSASSTGDTTQRLRLAAPRGRQKAIKFLDLVAASVIFSISIDMTRAPVTNGA
jgi:hypothetical protein